MELNGNFGNDVDAKVKIELMQYLYKLQSTTF